MNKKVYNTDVKTKKKHYKVFSKLIENQFKHGGTKYSLQGQDDKEATDWVCEIVPGVTGVDWVLGTMAKYIARFLTFRLEKDLLKIATYCYIVWLKMGFHLVEEHNEGISKEDESV